jgi:hypothetical protein
MLKKSMESRFNALKQVDRLKKDRNINSNEIAPGRNRPVVHPRLHFKKEGKVNKG